MQFQLVHAQPGWLMVNIGSPADPASWPAGWPVKTIPVDRQQFATNLLIATRENPAVRHILLINARGENYDAVPPLARELHDVPVFFLAGGILAWQECLVRELVMQNRRQVTLVSQTSGKFSRANHPAGKSGSCCGGSK